MAHHHLDSVYNRLVERLNKFPQGAPPSETLTKILQILVSEKEADLISQLPIIPFTAEKAAKAWKLDIASAKNTLEELASRAILLDMFQKNEQYYCLPPPMAGFFEFSMMRMRNDIDQKALAELFYQYLNVEEDFIKDLFRDNNTPIGRIFAKEEVIEENKLEVLDYDKASHIIKSASHIGISMCYCRHKKEHLGTACNAPMDICMSFNTTAASLTKHGHARLVDATECLDLLQKAKAHNLVQFGENVRNKVNYICNCCSCCCEALQAIKKFSLGRTIHSNYIASINPSACIGCKKCIEICPVNAIELNDISKKAQVISEKCIGCGVCTSHCKTKALNLENRPQRAITPKDTTNRIVITAAERGTLSELIADNDAMMSHKIMAAIINTLLNAPKPIREFALKQLKSKYIENLISKVE